MAEFASKGVAGSGLGLGIAGTALGVFNSGFFGRGGFFGGYEDGYRRDDGHHREDHHVNRYELNLVRELAAKDAIIVDKDSKLFTVEHVAKECGELNRRIDRMEHEMLNRFCYDEKKLQHFEDCYLPKQLMHYEPVHHHPIEVECHCHCKPHGEHKKPGTTA